MNPTTPKPEPGEPCEFAGHTPGPWTCGALFTWSNPDDGAFSGGEYNIFPPLGETGPVAVVNPNESDARLIAAAPRLLAERNAALRASHEHFTAARDMASENAALREEIRALRKQLEVENGALPLGSNIIAERDAALRERDHAAHSMEQHAKLAAMDAARCDTLAARLSQMEDALRDLVKEVEDVNDDEGCACDLMAAHVVAAGSKCAYCNARALLSPKALAGEGAR